MHCQAKMRATYVVLAVMEFPVEVERRVLHTVSFDLNYLRKLKSNKFSPLVFNLREFAIEIIDVFRCVISDELGNVSM